MTKVTVRNGFKLALGLGAACSVCCAPIIAPFVLAFVGGSSVVAWEWALGGVVVLMAAYFGLRRWRPTRDVAMSPDCGCGPSGCGGGVKSELS